MLKVRPMNVSIKSRFDRGILFLAVGMGLCSCVRNEFDIANLNTEVTIAENGLAVPLGSTKKIRVSELLSQSGADIISIDEGGLSLCISDTMDLSEQFPDFGNMFQLDGLDMSQESSFEVQGLDINDIAINEVDIRQDIDLNLNVDTDIQIPDIADERTISLHLYELAKSIQAVNLTKSLERKVIAQDIPINFPQIEPTGSTPVPIEIPRTNIANKSGVFNLNIASEDSKITHIRDMKMSPSSKMVVTVAITGDNFIREGRIIPDITLKTGDIFKITDESGNDLNGAIHIGTALDPSNGFTSISEFNLDRIDYNGNPMTSSMMVLGSIGFEDIKTSATDILVFDGKLRLEVRISFKDVSIESAKFDLEDTSISDSFTKTISLGSSILLPESIKGIGQVLFAQDSGLGFSLEMQNQVEGLNVILKKFSITIPQAIQLQSGSNSFNVYSNRFTGSYSKDFQFKALNLPAPEPGTNVVSWTDQISANTEFVINGYGLNSADFASSPQEDCSITSSINSNFEVEDWTAVIKDFEHRFDSFSQRIEQKIDGAVSEFGTFIVTPGGNPKVNISFETPSESMQILSGSGGMKLKFPDFLSFKNINPKYNYNIKDNSISFYSLIPRDIELEIDKLIIKPEKQADGTASIAGAFSIEGSMLFEGGTVSGSDLKSMSSGKPGITFSMPSMTGENVRLEEFKINIDESFQATLIDAEDLPSDVSINGISEAILDDVNVYFDIDIDGLPDLGKDKGYNADICISFPEEILLDPSDTRVENNVFHIVGTIEEGKLKADPVGIEAIDFSDYDFNAGEDLKAQICVRGKVSVPDPEIGQEVIKAEIVSNIGVKTDPIRFSRIKGKIGYAIQTDKQVFDVKGIPDMMTDESFNLDIANPALQLKVKTNAGIPLQGDLCIVPIRNGARDEEGKISIELGIDGTEDASVTDSVMIYVAATQNGKPEGYSFVANPNIKKLIKRLPDQIEFSMEANTDGTKESIIQPGADYALDLEYAFVCPLTFGEDFHITVRDTLKNLGENIGKILQSNKIQLAGEIVNQLPLALEMQIDLLDSKGVRIPLEISPRQQISSCSAEGEAVTSMLDLTLKAGDEADLSDFDAILLSFTATSGEAANVQVDDDAYLQANLKLILPEGINLDLADFGFGNGSGTDNSDAGDGSGSDAGNGSDGGNGSDSGDGSDSGNGSEDTGGSGTGNGSEDGNGSDGSDGSDAGNGSEKEDGSEEKVK